MFLITTFLFYLTIGVGSGILAGLFGIGGGIIIVPILIYCFTAQNMPSDIAIHMALGTSMAIIVFTSLSSIVSHHKRGAVYWPFLFWMGFGSILGCLIGSYIASMIEGKYLQKFIGIFVICIAINFIHSLIRKNREQESNIIKPTSPTHLTIAGTIIGLVSTIFGIGGGSLTIPFLNSRNFIMQKTVGTSAACALPISLFGAIGYMLIGWNTTALPHWSLGYIYLPALIGVSITSMFFARIGVTVAHRLSPRILKLLFSLLLIVIGCNLLLK